MTDSQLEAEDLSVCGKDLQDWIKSEAYQKLIHLDTYRGGHPVKYRYAKLAWFEDVPDEYYDDDTEPVDDPNMWFVEDQIVYIDLTFVSAPR
jgi:hypothetical protein